ncbi:N-acetyltransferase [Rhizobium pisi]|uniref:GNAT family N-acetyltransferase n=1 Tax=Rhizobium TaxID=379 RepID=UPI00103E5A81|nr:GNAT family protein [Rhizobium pisi]TCA57641.1 N-acetyltransferase [Rhizobium pisi]
MAPVKSEFPALLTDRLRLRESVFDDCGDVHDLLSIPEVTRFSNWSDAPKKGQTERVMKWMCGAFAKGKGCAWIIEDRASGRFLGSIRFNSIDKYSKWAEIGYELHPSFWGKGLMSDAVKAVARCGFDDFSLNRIEAWTLPGNPASDRVLEKAGFRYEGTLRHQAWFKNAFHDFRMFGRLAGEPPDLPKRS